MTKVSCSNDLFDHHKLYAICKSCGRSDSDADILVSSAVYNTLDVPDEEKMQCAVDNLNLYLRGVLRPTLTPNTGAI